MVRKKIDNRLRILVENGVANKHRSIVVVVGDHGRDQVFHLYPGKPVELICKV
jgi:N-acetyltransferase 10